MQASSTPSAAAFSVSKGASCDDCYFRRQGLCALDLERPCPTFRAAGRRLEPPYQPRLIARPIIAAV